MHICIKYRWIYIFERAKWMGRIFPKSNRDVLLLFFFLNNTPAAATATHYMQTLPQPLTYIYPPTLAAVLDGGAVWVAGVSLMGPATHTHTQPNPAPSTQGSMNATLPLFLLRLWGFGSEPIGCPVIHPNNLLIANAYNGFHLSWQRMGKYRVYTCDLIMSQPFLFWPPCELNVFNL